MDGYPSTPHLPFSPQVNADDVKLSSAASAHFAGQQVVITEKLDGGNCCLYAGERAQTRACVVPCVYPAR